MSTNESETPADGMPATPPGPYMEAIESYLSEATWLTAGDAPFKVHARSIARSLDQQLARANEIQSALASSFDKVMVRLEARRPPAAPAPTNPLADGPSGTASIFTQLD